MRAIFVYNCWLSMQLLLSIYATSKYLCKVDENLIFLLSTPKSFIVKIWSPYWRNIRMSVAILSHIYLRKEVMFSPLFNNNNNQLCLFVCLCVCSFICLLVCLFVCLLVCLSVSTMSQNVVNRFSQKFVERIYMS